MKHLRSIFRPQLRARILGQGHHRGGKTQCHSCSGATPARVPRAMPAWGSPLSLQLLACWALKEHRCTHSLVSAVELRSCLVSSVRTCSQYPCSVWPEVFCLLCCAACSAPSTEEQCFPRSELFTLPVPSLGSTFGMQPAAPSWDGSRHSPLGR